MPYISDNRIPLTTRKFADTGVESFVAARRREPDGNLIAISNMFSECSLQHLFLWSVIWLCRSPGFGDRRQLVATRLVSTSELLKPNVVMCYLEFQDYGCRSPRLRVMGFSDRRALPLHYTHVLSVL